MLFWCLVKPHLRKIAKFCMGPFGNTVLFALITGVLTYRLGWFGMGMAGALGLLVVNRLIEGEKGSSVGFGMGTMKMHLKAMEARNAHRDEQPEEETTPEEDKARQKQSDRFQLVSIGSLAMMAIGFVMFFRYQI